MFLFGDARFIKTLGYEPVAFLVFGTRDSEEDLADTLLRRRLDYTTVVVCFGTRDSKEELAMRLLLFILGRASRKKNGLCD